MRYINLLWLARRVTPEWKAKASDALTAVRAADPSRRARITNQHQGVWQDKDVKDLLSAASGGKCWYCESRESRSDAAVDHFRPKGKVAEDPKHRGYWWLAFDFMNYRYSCTFCNSRRTDRARGNAKGGKQTHFPLLNEPDRVCDERECGAEKPVLLDPTKAADTLLLYFREDGEVEPRYNQQVAAEKYYRAARSIEVYHLRHTALVEARLETLNRARELVQLGKVYYNSWLADNSEAFEVVVAELKKLCAADAEYSAAVVDFVKGFRDDVHPWVDTIA